MKPYFYVYRYQDKAPVIRHATLEAAQAEAERLATQHKGTCFEILKVVGLTQVSGPASTFFMDGEGPRMEEVKKQLSELASCVSESSTRF
jgi:hypothetical protein